MSYVKERKLIEDTFVLAFSTGLQTEVPDDDVMESFVDFVVARQKYQQTLAATPMEKKLGVDSKFKFNERFIYSCFPLFINRLQKEAKSGKAY